MKIFMHMIHFAENIANLRKSRKITQEQLADFIGVTKASVSKWETGQSMPDILLLPQLAGYFDVTIDELLGYEPMLSKEQIQKIYLDLAKAFATEEFEVVMGRSRELVKKYYSCYEFLEQIACLWVNHYMISVNNRAVEILQEAKTLCVHILENCKDIGLCNDVVLLKATIDLQLGNAAEVIEAIEDIYDPCRLTMQGEGILINAYLQKKELDKANDFTQIVMYQHLLALVNETFQYMVIHKEDLNKCEETLMRVTKLAQIYNLEELNFNVMAVAYYQMAIIYCQHDERQKALEQLEKYILLSDRFLMSEESHLKSDDYFDRLEVWFERTSLGGNAPRDKKVIYDGVVLSFETPSFQVLKEEPKFWELKKFVESRGDIYERNN